MGAWRHRRRGGLARGRAGASQAHKARHAIPGAREGLDASKGVAISAEATHRDDDYRIILSAVWQTVLRSNQRPNVVQKTLCAAGRRPDLPVMVCAP